MSPEQHGASRRPVILLTGRPGVGKTTVIRRLAELLSGRAIAGFYTDEIRVAGQRQGFRVTTFSGATDILAHTKTRSPHRVGRYGVDVAAFERIVLPELARAAEVLLVDEIGKMECFSASFVRAIRAILDGPTPIVATVALSGSGLIAEVKRRPEVELLELTAQNRDELPGQLAERVIRSVADPRRTHRDARSST
jgi:nucleoside-triphosphatase